MQSYKISLDIPPIPNFYAFLSLEYLQSTRERGGEEDADGFRASGGALDLGEREEVGIFEDGEHIFCGAVVVVVAAAAVEVRAEGAEVGGFMGRGLWGFGKGKEK